MDVLSAGAGNDNLTGGTDADTFEFELNHGLDTITDMEIGTDVMDLQALALSGFGDLTINNDAGGNAVVDTGNGTITLLGIDSAALSSSDFIF